MRSAATYGQWQKMIAKGSIQQRRKAIGTDQPDVLTIFLENTGFALSKETQTATAE